MNKTEQIRIQMQAALVNMEAAILKAEELAPTDDEKEIARRKVLVMDLEEMREKFPSGGPYTSVRRAITRTCEIINEKF